MRIVAEEKRERCGRATIEQLTEADSLSRPRSQGKANLRQRGVAMRREMSLVRGGPILSPRVFT